MGCDEGLEVFLKIRNPFGAIEGFPHPETGDDQIGLVIRQGGFLAREIGRAITGSQYVPAPSEIPDGYRFFLGSLQKKSLQVTMNAQLVGISIPDQGNPVARKNN